MGTLSDYRDRPHWSFSALNQFVNICSLQFYFDRIAKLQKAFTPATLAFGTAFHRTCEYVGLIRIEGRIPSREETEAVFAELWSRQLQEDKDLRFNDDDDDGSCDKQGRDMIGCLVDSIDPEERVIAVNHAFAVPLVDAAGNVLEKPLIGEIDVVVQKHSRKTLVDWKTSARRWPRDKAAKDLQPTAMLYGYKQLHGELPDFRFDVVVKNKTPAMEHHVTSRDDDDFSRMVALVTAVERAIAAECFLPNEQGFYCGGCGHQEACKAWHRNKSKVVSVAA